MQRALGIFAVALVIPIGSAQAADDRMAKQAGARLFGFSTFATHYKTIVINDPSAPLQIKRARTLTLSRGAREDMAVQLGIGRRHDLLRGRLVSIDAPSKRLTAAKFGVTFYDSFDDPAGGFVGIQMKPPTKGMVWVAQDEITWRKYGIACVYVQAVRFADGRVWKADFNKVAAMMIAKGCSSASRDLVAKRLKALPKGALRL